ncbi:CaiB/BaiF CoA transferase family protein [Actinophytocola sp. NPDC049390]|uniref:CaiB/BaiF CoA transferase family protein n=1 Tax=Actinophytocola sp. NPDC049390 TaxID=3363894 RepID=UPI00379D1C5E
MAGPLQGIRVVDFGHHVAGPLLAVMLADQGADVVHVDAPGNRDADRTADAFFNRGKRRISLDLTDPGDREVAHRLAARADVLVENFRPGVMTRLGLGWEQLRKAVPGLVYVSLPGFAPDDPRAGVRAWEGVVDAATGNCRLRAGEAPDGWDGSVPTYSAVPVASNFAAFLGAVGVVAALVERHRSGSGQHVSVPLFDAMFEAIGDAGAYVTAWGMAPPRPIRSNGSGTYLCADGGHVQFNPIGATRRFVAWFLRAADRPEWIDETDDDLLRKRLTALFATRTAQEWEDLGHAAGVPLARVRTPEEWLESAHARASGAVTRLDDPRLGPTLMPGAVLHVGDGQDPVGPRHLPDEDRDGILRELAAPAPDRPAPTGEPRRRPLEGLRVVDLTQILAGPTAGRILAELGADVVKVNAPGRTIFAHGVVNRGKRTVLLDVRDQPGQDVFWSLVDDADVVLQNFPPGTAERYGIGHERVNARKPDVVHVAVSCYGGIGPWAPGRGYETQGQAVTGLMARAGGPGRQPAVLGPYNLLDYGTGVLAAFGAVVGIYHRLVTGEGLRLRTSLAQASTYHQAAFLLKHARGAPGREPAGPGARGHTPLQRFYRASDRWFFLGATLADLYRLTEVAGFTVPRGRSLDVLQPRFDAAFATRTAREWVDVLRAMGIGAHEVVDLAELMTDPLVRERGLSVTQVSAEVGEVTMPGIALSMSATGPRIGAPVAPAGTDAVEVLDRIGLGAAVPDLEARGALQTAGLPHGWRR